MSDPVNVAGPAVAPPAHNRALATILADRAFAHPRL